MTTPQQLWTYDIETYVDMFCCGVVHYATQTRFIFEVSDRSDDSAAFVAFLDWLATTDQYMVGFNNEYFDWPVCDHLYRLFKRHGYFTAQDAYDKAQAIIGGNDRFGHAVWENQRVVPQIDLFKIHHFDNKARSTSLKKLEINMRARHVVDLPYSPHEPTNHSQRDEIIAYMCHDIHQTQHFLRHSLDMIGFRRDLKTKFPDIGDVLNYNDTKIGKKLFELQLEQSGIPCYVRENGRRSPRQTIRSRINIGDILSDKVIFRYPEFEQIRRWFSQQSIRPDQTNGFFKDVHCVVDGFRFDFGAGGIHGSLHRAKLLEDDEWEIWDWDVASYYPNIAITHGFFPAHLGEAFCDIYDGVFKTRRSYAKGTSENAAYKLALNGVYGDSNNVYGPFYDPQYTMSVTINGQLLLCVLAEMIDIKRPDIRLLQINTDGLTIMVRKSAVEHMKERCAAWEAWTGLELESVRYRSMHIRDVNNYVAVSTSGKIKRIGDYAIELASENPATRELTWYKDHSKRICQIAAVERMLNGTPIAETVMNHRDKFDFMIMAKVNRDCRLEHGDQEVQRTSRYYVSTDGHGLMKVMPPLAKNPDVERPISVEAGWTVSMANDANEFRWDNLNWLYYIREAEKLVVD